MASLVAMNMKRKDHGEVANHGFSIFLDPKRLKLQDGEIPEMMEEEEPSADAPIATEPTMVSWLQPPQGQEAVHDTMMNTAYGVRSSEQPFMEDQKSTGPAPMDVEAELRQWQPQTPCQHDQFFSGLF